MGYYSIFKYVDPSIVDAESLHRRRNGMHKATIASSVTRVDPEGIDVSILGVVPGRSAPQAQS